MKIWQIVLKIEPSSVNKLKQNSFKSKIRLCERNVESFKSLWLVVPEILTDPATNYCEI